MLGMKKTILLLFAVMLQLSVQGQMTLQAYRDSVYAASTEVANSIIKIDQSASVVKKEYAGFLPDVSADGSFTKNFRRDGNGKLWGFSITPTLSQTIYAGGGVRASWRQAKSDYNVSREEAQSIRLDMLYEADYAYWQVSATQLYKAATDHYVDIIRSLYNVVKNRYDEGYVAKGDLLQVEARLSEAEYSQIVMQSECEKAQHKFNNLGGWHEPMVVELAQSITDTIPMPQRVSYTEIIEHRPDIQAMAWRVKAAEYGVDVTRASLWPNMYVGVGGSWQTFSPNIKGHTYLDASIMLGVSVPIFHWGERRQAVASAKYDYRMAYNLWEQQRDDVEQEEADGWSALVSSYSQMQSSLRNLDIASENLSISTYSYQEGKATILEVLQAQISWIQIYTNAITARFNYAVAVSEYKHLTATD